MAECAGVSVPSTSDPSSRSHSLSPMLVSSLLSIWRRQASNITASLTFNPLPTLNSSARPFPELSAPHSSPPNLPLDHIHPHKLPIPQPPPIPPQTPLRINSPLHHPRLPLEEFDKFPKPNSSLVSQSENSPRSGGILIPNPKRDPFPRRLREKHLSR
jgi:hypothetical protein